MPEAARPLVVLDVVGLTPAQVAGPDAPALAALARDGFVTPLGAVLPAVTCPAQASMLTGTMPRQHGIVGNGWYFRDLAEIWLWRQSNRLVAGEKVWEAARRRRPGLTCAKLFWWYNMHSSADWTVTPRPAYPADGRKVPGLYCQPPELRAEIERELGPFPLFKFWGPGTDLTSSRWIADCARLVIERKRPSLTLVYLPHLDYDHQRHGPDDPRSRAALRAVDELVGGLVGHARRGGAEVLVVSEYGLRPVQRPVDINRALRRAGFLAVQETLGWELLDAGASRAFAVADHQVAHVYVRDPADQAKVRAVLEGLDGLAEVLDEDGKKAVGLDHPRAGELVAVAAPDAWFTYYYWLDDARAPDFAPTVDIHRKPGYDPAELFLRSEGAATKLRIGWRLLQKTLGFRYLLDVIPLHGQWVRGSHGRLPDDPAQGPVLIGSARALAPQTPPAMTDVFDLILRHLAPDHRGHQVTQ
jgi:predicted AlkP superfamily pyrophosphatase or phosphodiesterase